MKKALIVSLLLVILITLIVYHDFKVRLDFVAKIEIINNYVSTDTYNIKTIKSHDYILTTKDDLFHFLRTTPKIDQLKSINSVNLEEKSFLVSYDELESYKFKLINVTEDECWGYLYKGKKDYRIPLNHRICTPGKPKYIYIYSISKKFRYLCG